MAEIPVSEARIFAEEDVLFEDLLCDILQAVFLVSAHPLYCAVYRFYCSKDGYYRLSA